MTVEFTHLLSPQRIGNVVVRNRLVSSAHLTRLARGQRPTPEMIEYHAARARGGIGLIVLEGAAVHPTAVFDSSSALVAWDEEAVPLFRELADAVHRHGAKIFAQLLHMGRGASGGASGRPLWSASSVPSWMGSELAHAMTGAEIDEVIRWWARCAVNMKRASMDGVEIHGGHGYLVQQFLSPLTNHRTDEYGGALSDRARFALEVTRAVRKAVGRDFVVGMRLSADEMVPGGLTLAEMTDVARWLEETGDLDYLSISHSTSTDPMSFAKQVADMSWGQAPFIHLAEEIKKATGGIPVFGVCRITDAAVAERIVAEGKADMVCMTRAHIADPDICRKLTDGRPEDVRPCIGCNQGCAGRTWVGQPIGCLVNPEAGNEHQLGPIEPSGVRKSVVVVGGGPAGMEAARVAAYRGHAVSLYERRNRLGGQMVTAANAPYRKEFTSMIAWLEHQLERLGVSINLGAEATPEMLKRAAPDAVIVATGSVPELPQILGLDSPRAPRLAGPEEVLEGAVAVRGRVVVLDGDGHHKAVSTAEFAADQGAQVYLVARSGSIAPEIPPHSQAPVLHRLKDKRVTFLRETWIKEVRERRVILHDVYNGDEQSIDDVDTIIAVTPNRPDAWLHAALAESDVPQVVAVGDCVAPRRAIEAVRDGHLAGRAL